MLGPNYGEAGLCSNLHLTGCLSDNPPAGRHWLAPAIVNTDYNKNFLLAGWRFLSSSADSRQACLKRKGENITRPAAEDFVPLTSSTMLERDAAAFRLAVGKQ